MYPEVTGKPVNFSKDSRYTVIEFNKTPVGLVNNQEKIYELKAEIDVLQKELDIIDGCGSAQKLTTKKLT